MQLSISIVIAVTLALALDFSVRAIFGQRLHPLAFIGLYLVLFTFVRIVRGRFHARARPIPKDAISWPTSGPMGKLGGTALAMTFTLSSMLAFFNPLQLVQSVRQSVGNRRARSRAAATPTERPEQAMRERYRLPFDGEWCAIGGGITRETSHSWDVVAQRFAYDFVVVDGELKRHRGAGTRAADYFCYDRPILAAADGVVVATESRIGQAPFLGYGVADVFARNFIGNHVVIRHAENEFGFYAHLVRGSVLVEVGQRVTRGQQIGRCGHSGFSTEPHLHFHVQDREDFYSSAGVPIIFGDLCVDGVRTAAAYIRSGQRVRAA